MIDPPAEHELGLERGRSVDRPRPRGAEPQRNLCAARDPGAEA